MTTVRNPSDLVNEIKVAFSKLSYGDPRRSHFHGGISNLESMFWKATTPEYRNIIHGFYTSNYSDWLSYRYLSDYYRISTDYWINKDDVGVKQLVNLINEMVSNVGPESLPDSVKTQFPSGIPFSILDNHILIDTVLTVMKEGPNSSSNLELLDKSSAEEIMGKEVVDISNTGSPSTNIDSWTDSLAIDKMRENGHECYMKGVIHCFAYYDGNMYMTAYSIISQGEISHFYIQEIPTLEQIGDALLITSVIGAIPVSLSYSYATGFAVMFFGGFYFKFKTHVDEVIPGAIDAGGDAAKGISKGINSIAPFMGVIGLLFAGGYFMQSVPVISGYGTKRKRDTTTTKKVTRKKKK